ncbi:hypothetical protein [Brenneria tiliae]|uniref:hypothetical protein n=1 Tax=Brenneria tiliae TaxID=2914984 RepID=UPI00201499AC|nr:hypothetical protein [Brenneria tiliae]MCL2896658.1 hypothetical protein [Brenneria tiliae]MCL2901092.1 hypothetical protein [Brenneria tiliae]
MDTLIFNNNEDAYKEWLNDNPEGYVINLLKTAKGTERKSDINSTCLHRANCHSINPFVSDKEKTGFTTGQYQKICSLSEESAYKKAKELTGLKEIKPCSFCFKHVDI